MCTIFFASDVGLEFETLKSSTAEGRRMSGCSKGEERVDGLHAHVAASCRAQGQLIFIIPSLAYHLCRCGWVTVFETQAVIRSSPAQDHVCFFHEWYCSR
ncbi:hypothetical protein CY34DRAFT_808549 [Suillus luteus UH-Slu-Lm8-n1]|uniref:Uncharacterized protein n=1 Tax=Suillus luteus UH-Slu-Lm8-n1 TaxID=930992 RepID=A0A0C9ZNJ6_9AGAM|nr:hypothetical protein CY34DRAFT_808549 [Suillus luteus UH-Slu-Lm8-n1]